MGKSKKGGSPKGDQKSLRPGGVSPPKSPPDDPLGWKPFQSGLKDSYYPPSDDDPSKSPSSSGELKNDEINDINRTVDNIVQGSGVDILKRFQSGVCDKNIETARDTFQQFTEKIVLEEDQDMAAGLAAEFESRFTEALDMLEGFGYKSSLMNWKPEILKMELRDKEQV